jgi:hypothetical protein
MPARIPKSWPVVENSSLSNDDDILKSLRRLALSSDISSVKAHNRRCQIFSIDPAFTGLREPARNVHLLLTVSNGRVQNLGQAAGSILQETLHLAGPQSLPGGQNDAVATTAGAPLRESHGDDGSLFIALQSATSLNDLFERAIVHGVNLSDYPTGLFLMKICAQEGAPRTVGIERDRNFFLLFGADSITRIVGVFRAP